MAKGVVVIVFVVCKASHDLLVDYSRPYYKTKCPSEKTLTAPSPQRPQLTQSHGLNHREKFHIPIYFIAYPTKLLTFEVILGNVLDLQKDYFGMIIILMTFYTFYSRSAHCAVANFFFLVRPSTWTLGVCVSGRRVLMSWWRHRTWIRFII